MGYLPQFKFDIFISYRHASNASNNWVDEFHKELRASLEERVGKVEIWRDKFEIRAGDQWHSEIDEALNSAAIFLAIITRTYFDSYICATELDRFLARIKNPAEAIRPLIVPVYKLPPKSEQIPPELDGIHRHEFFQLDPYSEFAPGMGDGTERLFNIVLSRLALDLSMQLAKLSGHVRDQMIGTVYLAQASPELNPVREQLRSDLLQRGYWVVPEHPYIWNASDFEKKIAGDLDSAQLSIHLVSRGTSIEPTTHRHARLQLEYAAESMRLKQKPPPLVWIQPAEQIAEEASPLINYIKHDLANDGVEWFERSIQEFLNQIYDQLPKRPVSPKVSQACEIALIVEEGGIATTGEINNLLVQKLGRDFNRIQFSVSGPKDPSSFVKSLKRCGQCIIFWGAQSEDWVKEILALDGLAGYLGKERMCVFIAAPATPEKITFCTTKARTILETSTDKEAELREFLLSGGSRQ